VFRTYGAALDYGYMARRQLFFRALDPSVMDRVRRMAALVPFADQRGYAQALLAGANGDATRADAMIRELALTAAGNSRLLYTAVQAQLEQAARASQAVPADLERAIASLPVSAQATLRGVRLLRAQDLGGLAQLDAALAEADWTDPWFADAVQLRAEWRARVANPEVAKAYADEGIALLDRLAVVQPSLGLHVLRSRAALTADRPEVLIESVAQITSWTVALAGRTPSAQARTRTTLNELLSLLKDRERDARVDKVRLEEVRAKIRNALEEAGA
jgi:hypothetical protein